MTTEKKIGTTLFVVTAECSPAAAETLEKKLERILCRHANDTVSYQSEQEIPLAMCEKVREYTTNTIVRE